MKFEEKLMKLRKERALSQEELGEQLNVTRQTVSKWELGQSKPDMEKLIEISKFFGVNLEELTDDNVELEKNNVSTKTEKRKGERKYFIIILVIVGVLAIGLFISRLVGNIFVGTIGNIFNFASESKERGKEEFYDNFKGMMNMMEDKMEEEEQKYEQEREERKEQQEKEKQNSLEQYNQRVDQMEEEMKAQYDQQVEQMEQQQKEWAEQMGL